jgi:hypothetical protein
MGGRFIEDLAFNKVALRGRYSVHSCRLPRLGRWPSICTNFQKVQGSMSGGICIGWAASCLAVACELRLHYVSVKTTVHDIETALHWIGLVLHCCCAGGFHRDETNLQLVFLAFTTTMPMSID